MNGAHRSRSTRGVWLGIALAWLVLEGSTHALAAARDVDPAQVVPLDQLAPAHREEVAEIVREAHFHRKAKSDTFPANPRLYLALLNEPALTLALWKDLSPHPATLKCVAPGRYEGNDGNGTTATWEFLLRSPRLHVLLCTLDYVGPRGHPKLSGRIVLIIHSGYFKEQGGEPWIQHDVEAFVKIDSRGWKAVAATVRPLIEKLLDDQLQEAGLFVSVMARLVEMYPSWATGVTENQPQLSPPTRQNFGELVSQTRRPGALDGRPRMAENPPSDRLRR
jgi:hypothetical protein